MVGTHQRPEQGENSQQLGQNEAPLPPPPTLAEAIAALLDARTEQTELMRLLVQNTARTRRQEPLAPGGQQSTFGDFMATHPPVFSEAEEPLDADNWLRVIESKFGLLQCSEQQKPLFAAQQLRGHASAWWDSYKSTRAEGHVVEWQEFRTAFRSRYIPASLMDRKCSEFLKLEQGGKSVQAYARLFNTLCQYASRYVRDEDEKRDRFFRGLNPDIRE